jgi:hypothetical protein
MTNLTKKRNTSIVYKGEKKTVTQWAKDLGLTQTALRKRLVAPGWTTEMALTIPMRKYSK